MLNLIAHLLPDPVLGARWPDDPVQRRQLAARKWQRLCELGSTDGRALTWDVDGEQAIPGEFLALNLRIEGIRSFVWDFKNGYFVIHSLSQPASGRWPAPPDGEPASFLVRAWEDRLGLGTPAPLVKERPYEVFGKNLGDFSSTFLAVHFLTFLDSKAMNPVLQQILNTRIPEDRYALNQLGKFLYEWTKERDRDEPLIRALLPLAFLKELPQERKNVRGFRDGESMANFKIHARGKITA
jgi:hypothetical protein